MNLTWKKHPVLQPLTDEEIVKWDEHSILQYHEAYHRAIENAIADPLKFGFHLEPWKDFDKLLEEYDEVHAYGGNRCLAGEQEIWDPVAQENRRVDSIDSNFHVFAWDEQSKRKVVADAQRPFRKPEQELYHIQLSDGTEFRCSPTHRILTQKQWSSVSELDETSLVFAPVTEVALSYPSFQTGFGLSHPLSIWDIDLSASRQDVDRLMRIIEGSKCRYSAYLHQCGEPPRLLSSSDQYGLPSLGDVRECISCVSEHSDDLGCTPPRIRFYLQYDRPSILDGLRHLWGRCVDIVSRAFCKPYKSASQLCEDREIETSHLQSAVEFFRQPQSTGESGQLGIRFYYALASSYYTIPVKSDYLRTDTVWDFTVPRYHNYFIGSAVHHNSSKTTVGARTVVNAALQNKNALILCFAQDATASVRVQQKAVYEWLPAELKQNIKSDKGYIKYSLKNGFTGESLILPGTNSTIAFHTYSQFLNNPGKFEGVEVGSPDPVYTNVGIWLDEYLLGPDLVDTLRFRLATRDAKMILTFTPIDGITEFLNGYISGAETLESRYVDRFPNVTQNVPYIQRATKRDAAMIYFHSDRNPFGGPERLERDLKGRDRDEILTRFYGVPVKMMTGQFPMFKRSINVMPHDDMMQIVRADSRVTRYMIVDPAPSKRWFVTWIAVADDDAWYVYREWPDKSYGDWAEIGDKGKSRQGSASKPDGRGIRQYVELFQELENGEKIHERLIDPRMGATPRQIEEGTTTIIQQLEEEGCIVLPAPGGQRINGISYLHGLMSYNDKLPIDSVNRPKFYVSDRCEQTIDSLLNYTASEAVDKDAWSDPIDTLMYGGAAEIRYLGNVNMNATRTRAGGY